MNQNANFNLDSGIDVTVKRKSLFRFLYKRKERIFHFNSIFLDSICSIQDLFFKLYKDKEFLSTEWVDNPEAISKSDIDVCAKIAAIAYINYRFVSFFLSPFLAFYFKRRISPEKLAQLSFVIYKQTDFPALYASAQALAIPKSYQLLSKETHERNRSK
jgi:hypothetical protein